MGRTCVLHLKLEIMPQRVPRSPIITWGWLKFFYIKVILVEFAPTSEPWWGGSRHRELFKYQLELVVSHLFLSHFLTLQALVLLDWHEVSILAFDPWCIEGFAFWLTEFVCLCLQAHVSVDVRIGESLVWDSRIPLVRYNKVILILTCLIFLPSLQSVMSMRVVFLVTQVIALWHCHHLLGH